MLIEFGTIGASNKPTMICYFEKSLKSSIKVKIEKQDQVSASFKELIQKAVNGKAKIDLKFNIMIWEATFTILGIIIDLITLLLKCRLRI